MQSLVIVLLSLVLTPILGYRPSRLPLHDAVRPSNFARRIISLRESASNPTAAPAALTPVVAAASEPLKFEPPGTKFCLCSFCKTAYVIGEKDIGPRGGKVRCSVCSKEWYQMADKLLVTDDLNFLTDLSQEKIKDSKRIIADKNIPKNPRNDRTEVFVGNLNFQFNEEDVADLFAEYGVSNVAIVRDPERNSKGFGFVEFLTREDAERAVKEMNYFYTDKNRKLTVSMSSSSQRDNKPRPPRPDSRNQSPNGAPPRPPADSGGDRKWAKA